MIWVCVALLGIAIGSLVWCLHILREAERLLDKATEENSLAAWRLGVAQSTLDIAFGESDGTT